MSVGDLAEVEQHRVRRATATATGLVVLALAGCAGGADPNATGDASFGPGGGAGGDGMATEADDDDDDGDGDGDGDDADTDGATGLADGTADDDGADGGGDNGQVCQDGDSDGYGIGCPTGPDCDDEDPDINPGVAETCDGIDENCNDQIDDGCDCPDDGVSNNCNGPTDLGMIAVGDVVMGVVGNVPQDNGLDWYLVAFPNAARPGEGMPSIDFAINEGDAFAFDVVAGQCEATGAPCTSGGTSGAAIGLTSWTFVDDDPGCCTPPSDSMVPWPNPIYLRVYRTTMGPSCATYQLRVTR